MGDIHAKGITSNRLENVINNRRFQETEIDGLDVREVRGEFEFESHVTGEGHVLDEDGHSGADDAVSETNGEDDLGVDLGTQLTRGHVLDIRRCERHTPIHQLKKVVVDIYIRLVVWTASGLSLSGTRNDIIPRRERRRDLRQHRGQTWGRI